LLISTTEGADIIWLPPDRSIHRLSRNEDLKITMSEQDLHSTVPPADSGGNLIRLRRGSLEAVVSPRIGRLVSLQDVSGGNVDDILVPLREWPAESRRWAKAGAYPLIPYSNRVSNGKLRHAGRSFNVDPHPDAWPHSLHGHSHLLPWTAEASGQDNATLRVVAEPGKDWPWRFTAWQSFELSPDGLRVKLGIQNLDGESFPAGIGWHPYFAWAPDYAIRHDARWWWPFDEEYLPTQERRSLKGQDDPLLSHRTAYLTEWTHVDMDRGDRPGLRLTADKILSHLVIHHVPGGAYVCIEPVSHLADSFNLAESGLEGTGIQVLEPGQALAGWIELRLVPAHREEALRTS
jgi:aldose 1-epimerase